MCVIIGAVNRDRFNSLVVAVARHIAPELRLKLFRNEFLSFFCAKDQVEMDAGKGIRHAYSSQRGGLSNSAQPSNTQCRFEL